MKTKKFALLIILSMLVTGFAGAGSYIVEDDIYYNPNDKNPIVEKKEKEAQKELQEKAAVKKTLMATSDNHFRDVDEYNRRGESSDMTLEDIAANQKEYPKNKYRNRMGRLPKRQTLDCGNGECAKRIHNPSRSR